MRSLVFFLLILNISIFTIKKYKRDYKIAPKLASFRTIEQINYEKCLLIRDYYKNRLEKLKKIKNLVSEKEYLELEMLLGKSEYELEIAKIKNGREGI